VRVLLSDYGGAESTLLVPLLEQSGLQVALAGSLAAQTNEPIEAFDAVAIGARGPLEERVEQCRRLRKEGYAGTILVVCADLAEWRPLLDAGADDFVALPFDALELATRLGASPRSAAAHPHLRWGPLDLDRLHRIVQLHGNTIALTAREYDLLVLLVEAGGRVVSRAALRERLRRRKQDRGSNLVEVHLCRLRDKLGADAGLIETVRRSGYRLRR
jgi:DNA-binding response OmpR family regulator